MELPSLSDHRVTSPPEVVKVLLAAWVIFPAPFKIMSPAAPPAVVFRFSLIVTSPPYTEIGPAMVCAAVTVTVDVLVDLPKLSPVKPLATEKLAIGQESALVKLVECGSTTKMPVASTVIPLFTVI